MRSSTQGKVISSNDRTKTNVNNHLLEAGYKVKRQLWDYYPHHKAGKKEFCWDDIVMYFIFNTTFHYRTRIRFSNELEMMKKGIESKCK